MSGQVPEPATAIADLPGALARLARTERLLVCCDYDGTLAAIVDDPAAAWPAPGAVAALARVADRPETVVAVLTGRSLASLARLAPLPAGVRRLGGHGVERDGEPVVVDAALLAAVHRACEEITLGVSGALVEDKPASVAVHVRRCRRPDAERVLAAVRAGPATWPGVHVMAGKEVLELAVLALDKGRAVAELQAESAATGSLFIGDDTTDEAAFARLGPDDVGIKVGPGPTTARYRLPDVAAVVAVLDRLAALRSG